MSTMTGNPYLKLQRVTPKGGHKLELEYTDGLTATLDFSGHLRGEIRQPLRDPAYFARVTVDESMDTIVWPNECDVCPDVLRYWAETGRITSQEETDAHFAVLLQPHGAA